MRLTFPQWTGLWPHSRSLRPVAVQIGRSIQRPSALAAFSVAPRAHRQDPTRTNEIGESRPLEKSSRLRAVPSSRNEPPKTKTAAASELLSPRSRIRTSIPKIKYDSTSENPFNGLSLGYNPAVKADASSVKNTVNMDTLLSSITEGSRLGNRPQKPYASASKYESKHGHSKLASPLGALKSRPASKPNGDQAPISFLEALKTQQDIPKRLHDRTRSESITQPPVSWDKLVEGFHILVLENCGNTMLKSDIERIFSNHEAKVGGWRVSGTEIAHIVPARNARFQRISRYYLYFRTFGAATHHLQHSIITQPPKKLISWDAITLPPPAATTHWSDAIQHGFNDDDDPSVGFMDIEPWKPVLKMVKYSRASSHGGIPSSLFQNGGGPGRTVFLCMTANSHWQYLQVWIKYEIIENGGFGRYLTEGGDSDGWGLERVPLYNEAVFEEGNIGGGWLVRFREGLESEAERLVREWDGKWVKINGTTCRIKAELQW